MFVKGLIGLFVLVLWCTTAQAQHIESQEFLLQNASVAAAANGAPMPVDHYTSVAVDVTVSVTGNVNFEASGAGGVWSSTTCVQSSVAARTHVAVATATGLFQCNVAGFQSFRARTDTNAGSITVFARATTAPFE